MHYIDSLVALASVSALLTWGSACAQTYTPGAERWPRTSDDRDLERRQTIFEMEMDRGYDAPATIRPQPLDSAIVTLHELAHHVPRRAEREFQRALAAREKGDREMAILSFRKAIAIDPDFCAALNDLGVSYLETDRIDLAIEQFDKAVAIDPHAPKPYANLAIAYLRKGEYADAERAARRVIDLDRAGTHGHLALGVSLVLQNKYTDQMERSLRKAVADFPGAGFWLALGLLGKGQIHDAKGKLEEYLARDGQGDTELARSLLRRVQSLAQNKE